MKEEG
jgi:hypothetical protein